MSIAGLMRFRLIVIVGVLLAANVAADYDADDSLGTAIERIDQDYELAADDGSFGLRLSKKKDKPSKRGLIPVQSSPTPIQAVPYQEQVQPIIYTSPSAFKKEPSVHNAFNFGLLSNDKTRVESSTASSTTTIDYDKVTLPAGSSSERPANPWPESPRADSLASFLTQSGPTSADAAQLDTQPWLRYLVERDETNQQAGHRAEVTPKSTEHQSSGQSSRAESIQQSYFSLPPFGASNDLSNYHSSNHEFTPTPSSVASFQSPPTPGLSYSYLVLGSTEPPKAIAAKQIAYPSQASKLPPLPIIPLAFRQPKNVAASNEERKKPKSSIVLNLKGDTWGPPFKLPETPRQASQNAEQSPTGPPSNQQYSSNSAQSSGDNLGFFVPPTAFRASNSLPGFSTEPIKPSFTLKSFPTNEAFSEPASFVPYSNNFQADVLSFIRTHSNFNAALSLKNSNNSGKLNRATQRPTLSPPSYYDPPSSVPSPPSFPASTAPPSYPASTAPPSYAVKPGPVTTTYRPPASPSYPSQAPAVQPNYATSAPSKSPSSTYGPPPKASYGAPQSSYGQPAKPSTSQKFTPSDAAPAYPKQADSNPQYSTQASPPSNPASYAPPPPPPIISVTVSSSTPQSVVGAQGPSYVNSPQRPQGLSGPVPQQLPRPVVPAQLPRPFTPTNQFRPSPSVASNGQSYNQQSAPPVRLPVPASYLSPPKNVNYGNTLLSPQVKQYSSQIVPQAAPQPASNKVGHEASTKPVQVYLTYG